MENDGPDTFTNRVNAAGVACLQQVLRELGHDEEPEKTLRYVLERIEETTDYMITTPDLERERQGYKDQVDSLMHTFIYRQRQEIINDRKKRWLKAEEEDDLPF